MSKVSCEPSYGVSFYKLKLEFDLLGHKLLLSSDEDFHLQVLQSFSKTVVTTKEALLELSCHLVNP
jgi:hypothetical protein